MNQESRIRNYGKKIKKIYNSLFILHNSHQGFTLLELLVVIAIIGVLSAGVIVAINPVNQLQKTNDARRKSDLSQVQKALEQYYQDTNQYPCSSTNYQIIGLDGAEKPWGASFVPYMPKLPQDPTGGRKYVYYSSDVNCTQKPQSYYLYASLEQGGKDAQACFVSGAACLSVSANRLADIACGGSEAICNYGVTSPNVSR